MRIVQQPAFVLHRRPYRETSLLLEVFTRGYGRLGLLAKGARRPSRQALGGVLKPFQELLIGWSGRGELPVLTGAEPHGEAIELGGEALYCGFYMNELLLRLLHRHDPHEGLFDDYRTALAALGPQPGAQGPGGQEAVLRVFEKRLLAAIGYGLVLDRDISDGSPIEPSAVYDYIPERGPVRLADGTGNGIASHSESVRVRGATLRGLQDETLDAEGLREAKRLLRSALARHLGPRPLVSRELYARLRAMRARTPRTSE